MRRFLLALLVGALGHGCADEGATIHPSEVIPLEECPHFIPSGLRLDQGASLVYDEFNGVLRGGIDLPTLGLERDFACTWFDSDSSLIEAPGVECPNHWMDWTVGDSTVVEASANPATKWGMHLHARRDGTTTIRLRPIHDEDGFQHSHFISREITVRVGDGGAGVPLTGVRLATASGEIAKERRGAVNGGVSLQANALSPEIEVRIFGANSDLIDPTTLALAPEVAWTVGDTTIAILDRSTESAAELRLLGVTEGSTSLQLTLTSRGRVEYTSAPIPVVVGPGHPSLGVLALAVRLNSTMVSSWNYNPVLTPDLATGGLWLRPKVTSGQFEVQFLGAFDDVSELREVLDPLDSRYTLGWEIEDPEVAMFEPTPGQRFVLNAMGMESGRTQVRFSLRYDGIEEYVSGWLPIEVESDPVSTPDFLLKRNGIWSVIYRGGVFGDACSHTANPGYLGAEVGQTTEENLLRLLDPNCLQVAPDELTHSLQYEFADPGIAKALAYPEHSHSGIEFHLVGLGAGETTLRIRLLEGDQVVMVTPPIPVRVVAPGTSTN